MSGGMEGKELAFFVVVCIFRVWRHCCVLACVRARVCDSVCAAMGEKVVRSFTPHALRARVCVCVPSPTVDPEMLAAGGLTGFQVWGMCVHVRTTRVSAVRFCSCLRVCDRARGACCMRERCVDRVVCV